MAGSSTAGEKRQANHIAGMQGGQALKPAGAMRTILTLLIVLRLVHSVLARYSRDFTFHFSWNSSVCSHAASTPCRPASFSKLATLTRLSCLVAFLRSLRISSAREGKTRRGSNRGLGRHLGGIAT